MTSRIPLPPMKDRSSWHIFCVGLDEASGNSGAYFGDEYECGYDNVAKQQGEQKEKKDNCLLTEELPSCWRMNLPSDGYEPTVRLLLQMDQVMIRRVISHLTHYIHFGWSIMTGRRAEWIYALLTRLEKPIHRDDSAVLFGLLKDLTLARSKILVPGNKDRISLAKLNVLIVIIGVYFEQGGDLSRFMTCE